MGKIPRKITRYFLLVALVGILIMWGVAWLNSWYKRIDSGTAARYGRVGSTADIVGGR